MQKDHRFGPLTKSTLQYKYPSGPTANDDPTVRNLPDSVLLNRHEWYEVLYFANKFANMVVTPAGSKEAALKVERLLRTAVPSNLRSHSHVSDWLIQNWNAFPS